MSLVFCDFDGTIITRDSCLELLKYSSDPARVNAVEEAWEAGRVSTPEAARAILATIKMPLNELVEILGQIPLRPGFEEFLRLCQTLGFPIFVLSDGYQAIIHKRLAQFPLPNYSNILYESGGALKADFPFFNPECGLCGCCKKSIIRRFKARHATDGPVIVIGDGKSDLCAIKEAELVFATGRLPELARKVGIGYLDFDDFFEILAHRAFRP